LGSEMEQKQKAGPETARGGGLHEAVAPAEGMLGARNAEPVPLSYLTGVCPSLASYARDGISSWADVLRTADLVRSMLGISPDAWRKAREAMGEIPAACTLAAILERVEHIRSPGGYLRVLAARAELGKFSIRPMLAALENNKHRD